MEDFAILLQRREPLDPELEAYLEVGGGDRWSMLKHPLVFQVPYSPELAALANAQLRYKQEAVLRATRERSWASVIWLHERPYRLDAFESIQRELTPEEYWRLLGSVWVDTENYWQNVVRWLGYWADPRPGREHAMDDEERGALRGQPDEITVYRGTIRKATMGLSWTTDRDRAVWFARRYTPHIRESMVMRGAVARDAVWAYFLGRGEAEVVVHPRSVQHVIIEEAK